MTNGLIKSGIEVVAGIDNDPMCKDTYEKNNKGAKFILKDVFDLKERELQLTIEKPLQVLQEAVSHIDDEDKLLEPPNDILKKN